MCLFGRHSCEHGIEEGRVHSRGVGQAECIIRGKSHDSIQPRVAMPVRFETMDELLEDSPPGVWVPDILPGFERLTIPLGEDDEGPVVATLVRMDGQHRPDGGSAGNDRPVLLYLHGWADYFYNRELAVRCENAGVRFYALDLRKYGRSLREGQTPGFTESLDLYDDEIGAAFHLLRSEHPNSPAPVLAGHSTGGLVASLWADRHPHQLSALVLNSAWLELMGASWVRAMATALVDPMSRISPTSSMVLPRINSYWRTLSSQADGEWDLHPLWRPEYSFEVPRGWLAAVLQGHRRVASGLKITAPILALFSTQSYFGTTIDERAHSADIVLDVKILARRAVNLGNEVTVLRLPGAIHDVFASRPSVRNDAMDRTFRWLERQLD